MPDANNAPPEVDTDPAKLAELAAKEDAAGVVDQQAAGAAKPDAEPKKSDAAD